jgi:hypothetical protein
VIKKHELPFFAKEERERERERERKRKRITLIFGESASGGTGMTISTLLAVERGLN